MSNWLVKIINYEYRDQAADLINAKPTGPVEGYHLNSTSNNQSWDIVPIYDDFITIQNGSTKTYANPAAERPGAKIIGGSYAYAWKQIPLPGGFVQIATHDGTFVWKLTGDKDYASIVLKTTPYLGNDAQWGYEATPEVT